MEKILAIVFLVLFVWLAIPRLVQGQWLAPSAIPPNSWTQQYDSSGLASAIDSGAPAVGFGWFHFDFWNHPSQTGEQATTQDLHFRSPSSEF